VVQGRFNQHPTDADRLVHPRLEKEREKQKIWREKSVEGGIKSGETRRINSLRGISDLKGGSTILQLN
jgi:hypothetical protein